MAFLYRLEREDGTPADPPTLRTAVPVWAPDTIPLGRDRPLRVIDVQPGNDPDGDPERTTCGSSHTRSSFVQRRPRPGCPVVGLMMFQNPDGFAETIAQALSGSA